MQNSIALIFACITIASSSFSQTVTDIDGNTYNTVVIGTQEWMQENLKVTTYNNGDPIPLILNIADWYPAASGAYAYYNNDITNLTTYGALYSGYVVQDTRGVCPAGWHVPEDDEWRLMLKTICATGDCDSTWAYGNTISGNQGTDEGGKIKETGTVHWSSPNTGATNSSGFTALPSGYRYWDGNYYTINIYTVFWTATEHATPINMWFYAPYHNQSEIYHGYGDKMNGNSIRCVRPASNLGNEILNSDEILIYPNPVHDILSIQVDQQKVDLLQLFDLKGNLVLESQLIPGQNKISIDHLVAGIYVVKMSGERQVIQQKLVKE